MNQVAHKVAPSIATNNRMVLKPTEKMPLSALLLADILYEAGLPPEMFSGRHRRPARDRRRDADQSRTSTSSPSPAAWRSANTSPPRPVYKRQVLELGGNDPIIVMDDADLDEAASLAAGGSYKNSGQRCTAVKRMLVHEQVADRLRRAAAGEDARLDATATRWTRTSTWARSSTRRPRSCSRRRVNEAVAQGARLLHGNVRDGALYSPTLLDHVRRDMTAGASRKPSARCRR